MTNQLTKSILFTIILLSGIISSAQIVTDAPIGEESVQYRIGEVKVTGSQSYNENTVRAFTGLRPGMEIYVPGEKLSNVVKKMWDLKLFSDIRIYATSIEGDPTDEFIDTINLEIYIVEVPNVRNVEITGLRKGKAKDLREELKLQKGTKATENLITNTRTFIENKYRKKGFLNADALVRIKEVQNDSTADNQVDMKIDVDRGKKPKISYIDFEGNELISDKKLRKAMKNTKKRNILRIFKR